MGIYILLGYIAFMFCFFFVGTLVIECIGMLCTYAYEKLIQLSYIDISADTCLIINAFFLLRIVDTIFNNHKDVNFEMNKV